MLAPDPSRRWIRERARPDRRSSRSSAPSTGRSSWSPRSPCGSRNCALSSGSWSTRSAARAGRDGARRPERLGRLRRVQRSRFLPPARRRGRRSRPSTAGRRTGCGPATRSAPRSSSGVRGRCRGRSPMRPAVPSRGRGRRTRSARSRNAIRTDLPAAAGRVSHLRIDPEIELDGPRDPDGGSLRLALREAGWRPAAPIQPASTRVIDLRPDEDALWGDLRKKWRQYVNKAKSRRCRRRGRRGRPAGRVLPDLSRYRGPGRVPDPDRGGVPRRLGRLSTGRAAPGCCSPRRPTASRSPRSSSSAADRGSWSRTAA